MLMEEQPDRQQRMAAAEPSGGSTIHSNLLLGTHMTDHGCHAVRLRLKLLIGAVLLTCQGAMIRVAAGEWMARVELDCKLVPSSPGLGLKSWLVEVRKTNGEPLRDTRKFGGDIARFKDLEPGIYIVCIAGEDGRKHCESVDLNPPAKSRFFRFEKQLQTPPPALHQPDAHRVNLRRLSVSKDAWLEMGRWKIAQLRGKSREAIEHLERALQICPDYPEALNNMGVYYLSRHNYTKSIQYLQKATEADPGLYAAWVNLGSSLLAIGEFQQALETNKRAYALQPNEAAVNSQLAMNYYYLRNYPEAKKYFEKVLELDPLSASAPHLFLAQMSIVQRKDAEAERYIQGFLDLHPNSPQVSRLREVLKEVSAKHLVAVPSADISVGP
jgi:tetratricopeptide (TPR) repeat protein